MISDFKDIKNLLTKCLDTDAVTINKAEPITSGSGCDVLDCSFTLNGRPSEGILKIFSEGYDDYSEIGVMRMARKNVLAANELNAGILHIPGVTGYYLAEQTPAILYEKLSASEWNPGTRIKAAEVLAQLHNTAINSLSDDLRKDVTDSKPNKDRIRNGVLHFPEVLDNKKPGWRDSHPQLARDADELKNNEEPVSAMTTLVHGDFFALNILPAEDKIYIIDWDLLALGDPMWDLGFLAGTEKDLAQEEVDAVIKEYGKQREIDDEVLAWHMKCWKTYFKLRDIVDTIR
jgi:hypothetical protein